MSSGGLDREGARLLLRASRGLVSELDLEAVLERVLRTAQELTGARHAAVGIPDERRAELERFLPRGSGEGMHAFGEMPHGPDTLEVPVLIRGEAWGKLYLSEKPGGSFTTADEETVAVLAEWAAVAIDTARLYEREAARRGELERAVRALKASTAIARALGGETDLERVLELIVRRGRALVEARAMLILLRDGDSLEVRAEAGAIAGSALGRRIQMDASSGRVLVGAKPRRIDDLAGQSSIAFDELGVGAARTALLVPLVYRGQGVGVLVAFDRLRKGPRFRAEDERLLIGFAASAATAVSTAQSVERERLRHSLESAEQERRRWARKLHDETLQGLGAVVLGLSTARLLGDAEALDQSVGEAIGYLGDEIANLRAMITDLGPAALDALGVAPALEALTASMAAQHGLDIVLDVRLEYEAEQRPSRLVAELETVVYRAVQEALVNAAQHAAASRIQVTVTRLRERILVAVADDGRGFDPARATEGFGLVSIHERVALVGGRVEITSSEQGTTLELELPARHRDDDTARVVA